MSGLSLTPSFSAKLAERVYLVGDEITRRLLIGEFKKYLEMEGANFVTGA